MTDDQIESNRRRRLVAGLGAAALGANAGIGSGLAASDIGTSKTVTAHSVDEITWEVPTAESASEDDVEAALDAVETELGVRPTGSQTETGAEFTASAETGDGEGLLLHPVLDVVESFLQNTLGQPGDGIVKSTLTAHGSETATVQPSIELSGAPGAAEAQEIEKLAALVLGVSVAVDAESTENGTRVYVDTGLAELGHGSLDVIEIVARRIAEREGLDVLDDDAHPIVTREAVTNGLGDNTEAGGLIEGEVGNPLNPYPKDAEKELSDLTFGRPTDGETRIAWHFPTGIQPTQSDVTEFLDIVEDELGVRPDGTATENGVLYEIEAGEFVHPVLDVAESTAANALGKPDVEGSVKSTLFVAGDATDTTVQPGFELSEQFSDEVVAEIERLYQFVAGVNATGYHDGTRFFLDPGTATLGHLQVDVAEILVRRFAAATGIDVEDDDAHTISARQQEQVQVTFDVPTAVQPSADAVDSMLDTVEQEIGVSPTAELIDGGVRVTAPGVTGGGRTALLHPVLDVSESFLQNQFGAPGEGIVKSTLAVSGSAADTTMQPSIELSGAPGAAEAQEIEKLAALVLGVSVAVDAESTENGTRVYVDTGLAELGHGSLDVIEIVARRIAEREGLDVLDDDAHPINARPAVTNGLGDNTEAGGLIEGEAGDPLSPYPKDGEKNLSDLTFDRPTDGETRIAWHFPTGVQPTQSDVDGFLDIVEDELGVRPDGTATENGVLYEVPAGEFVHPVLDVAESTAANALGKPDVEGSVKSTLYVAGEESGESVQPNFGLSEPFPDEVVVEIERLYEFVAGVNASGYHENSRLYLDTGGTALGHLDVDVAEILVRRFAAATGIEVTDDDAHRISVRERETGEGPPALPGAENPPADIDGDGLYEDINGDGEFDIFDVRALFANRNAPVVQNNAEFFDFDDSGGEVDIFDVRALFNELNQ